MKETEYVAQNKDAGGEDAKIPESEDASRGVRGQSVGDEGGLVVRAETLLNGGRDRHAAWPRGRRSPGFSTVVTDR